MHGTICPFDSAILTETAWVVEAWQTGARRRHVCVRGWVGIITRSEQNSGTTRGLAPVILTIGGLIISWGFSSIIVTLKEIFQVLDSVIVKIVLTVVNMILDVLFGERIEENDFCFSIIKFFFVTMVQKLDRTQCFLEAGVK